MMLHKLTSSYREIAKYFPELNNKLSPSARSARNRKLLLKMAREGKKRPSQKSYLGVALNTYTSCRRSRESFSLNLTFAKKIKKLRPDWFDKTANKRQLLLAIAKKGRPKPGRATELGRALNHYTTKSSYCYHDKFTKQIKKLRPEWMNMAEHKKQLIMKLATNGRPKPACGTVLGYALKNYTAKSSSSFDPVFTKQIKKLAPHWFKRCSTKSKAVTKK